ncbi:peptide/nickel transport system permease protein/oligopeptide transport system permease protein [Motilibacter peucedani]|uniref:Peptide/nickel transport system permease protein/oligopeptide transport system permease protein n=1 Tax=Motilibacter peucedani TaxID=598650 RepID=A0A420XMA9_9ACTN|nr:ABC transporter permease [Motilibacter peucedani]RKS72413.1 peptide/nickel transport system permease protein/oligopeptide transport system permease protein [Motilibacter peucedani]
MGRYTARRLLQIIPVLFGTTLLIFAMVYALPGDKVQRISGEKKPDPARVLYLRHKYNLDDPLVVQYGKYVGKLASGDFGETRNQRPVTDLLKEEYPVSLKLGLVGILFEAAIGLGVGIIAGLKRNGLFDRTVLITTLVLVSIPSFVICFVLQLLVGVKWRGFFHLPVSGIRDGFPEAFILPGFCVSLLGLAVLSRLTRTTLIENLRSDYVRTAVAKGVPRRRIITVHTLRNTMIPIITQIGADLSSIMGTAVVTETVFNLPGVGQQMAQSVRAADAPVIVGIVTLLVLIYAFLNLVIDLMYAVLDPRIRYD